MTAYNRIKLELAQHSNDSWKKASEIQIETAGNYVYRFSAWDIYSLSRALFIKCHTTRLFAAHHVAKSAFEFVVLKALNLEANLLCPQVGN
jgi:phage-related protein